jgi:thioredoxin
MEELPVGAFEGTTLQRPGRYAVVFEADWCPFCRAFLPMFQTLEGDPSVRSARVDLTDLENPLWERFDVEVVPSIVIFRDGRVVARVDGVYGVGLGPAAVERARTLAAA